MLPKDRIQKLLQDIQDKKNELASEYEKLSDRFREKYDFSFEKGRVRFSKKAKEYQKRFKTPLGIYVIPRSYRHILSIPFIYGMIIPTVILDIFLFIYQQTALRLYGIPLVKRRDYIIFERKHLSYLNMIQKINCLYCSYVNGLFQYAVEVAGRTEKYWCPIKSARRKAGIHSWEEYFADFGDPEGFKKQFNCNKEFFQKKKNKSI
ncbi:hypothetical protein LAT59_03005 [Candidatus Gracilibacteria bacterium]|nr:hypothetical protein [Candidatus Gracilibacteria bacterium]